MVTCVLTDPVRPNVRGVGRPRESSPPDRRHAQLAHGLAVVPRCRRAPRPRRRQSPRRLPRDGCPTRFAYGFEVFRMVDDDRHFDPRSLWVFRLFAAHRRDHAAALQTAAFRSGAGRHSARTVVVHQPAHPTRRQPHDRAPPGPIRRVSAGRPRQRMPERLHRPPRRAARRRMARPSRRPAGAARHRRPLRRPAHQRSSTGPAITAVVIAQNECDVIGQAVSALVDRAVDDASFERRRRVQRIGRHLRAGHAANYPTVRAVQLPQPVLPGEARNAGLWMAGGEYVTFPGSHVRLRPGSLQARLDAHDDGWDLVTGSVVNGNPTRAGWASYLLDHAAQVPSRKPGEFNGVPGHASYVTRDVRGVGGFPEDMRAGEDTVVNRALFFAGKRTYFCPAASFAHASPSTGPIHLLRHHFQRGRALGRIIRKTAAGESDWRRCTPRPRCRNADSPTSPRRSTRPVTTCADSTEDSCVSTSPPAP